MVFMVCSWLWVQVLHLSDRRGRQPGNTTGPWPMC